LTLALFFATAYAISWAAWLAVWAFCLSPFWGVGRAFYIVAILAPHASALVVSAVREGRAGVRSLYARFTRRLGIQCIVVAIALAPAVNLARDAAATIAHAPHGPWVHAPPRSAAALLIGQATVVFGEETGWRAFALPRLADRFGPIAGTLILGVLWSAWHAPLFLIPGTPQAGTSFLEFVVELTSWSMVITWLVLRSNGSVLPAMLFHSVANICDFVMWMPEGGWFELAPWVVAAGFAAWRISARAPRSRHAAHG
jgi:membrane protease YdiL (CAAX protease family)